MNPSAGMWAHRFDLIPHYGTEQYDPDHHFQTLQDFYAKSTCTHTFTAAGSYMVVVWASDTAGIPTGIAPPWIGGSITVEE